VKRRAIEVVEVFDIESRGGLIVLGKGMLPEPHDVLLVNGKAKIHVLGLEFHQPKESGKIAFVVERGEKLQPGDVLLPAPEAIP
jgi:hypothetical protein